ncbi:metal-sulfur cluster biosynthetic enzyme [Sulfolobus acidocaldarius SUSAZ]|nr:metal-sulfur cluster biosynthetic enzyme [Sulfolobus acidocaldarius SUSAZ]
MYKMKFLKGYYEDDKGNLHLIISPPTFWCPPLFLYIMLEEIRNRLPDAIIEVRDHHDSKKLSECINNGLKFHECYSNESLNGDEYDKVKRSFEEKRSNKYGKLVQLSLNMNGELCKLIAEAKER